MGDACGDGQVVSVHVGGAGVRVGTALWEALCLEHGVGVDARPRRGGELFDGDSCFWTEGRQGRHLRARPRALLVDTATEELDEVLTGPFKELFPAESVARGNGDDAASVFARAYHGVGVRVANQALKRMRVMLERCDHLQTVHVYHSRGGGTGAGLTALLVERLQDDLLDGKVPVIQLAVNPAKTHNKSTQLSGAVVEPYNAALCAHALYAHTDCAVHFDSAALLAVCRRHLRMPEPSMRSGNRVLAQLAAALTAQARLGPGARAGDTLELTRSLVPRPPLKYLLSSLAPLGWTSGRSTPPLDVATLSRQTFLGEHHLADFQPRSLDSRTRYLGCALLYRGDVEAHQVAPALDAVRSLGRFKQTQCPELKVSLCARNGASPPFSALGDSPRACAQLLNTTAAARHWRDARAAFDAMWQQRAFVHLYEAEGMEREAFHGAEEFCRRVEEAYGEAQRTG